MGSPKEEVEEDLRRLGVAQTMGDEFVASTIRDEHRHRVTVSSFLIAKFEVTQSVWEKVMGELPARLSSRVYSHGDHFPVELLSWHDAHKFCKETGLRLPTEAQWEYACRAGNEGKYSGTGILEEMGWYEENSGRRSHPVGQKKSNGFGLYDMHGNVSEWCLDEYSSHFYTTPEASERDPVCTSGAGTKAQRGGDYRQIALNVRSAVRGGEGADTQGHAVGVRPVFYLPP